MAEQLFHFPRRIRAPRGKIEFARGQGGRHADQPHIRLGHIGLIDCAIFADTGEIAVQLSGVAHIVGETKDHHFAAVGHRATAQRDYQIGARLTRLVGGINHGVTRRMRTNLVV